MIYGYIRVSSKNQFDNNSFEEQEQKILERYPDAIINKEQFTGTTTDRPIFIKVIDNLKSGDVLVTTKLDRFCRNTKEGLDIIDTLLPKNISIHILNMGLIDNTPMGRLIVTNLLAFAEFERAMIVERTQSGKAIAKTKHGFKEGRPKKYTKVQLNHAISLLENYSYNKVAEITGISKSTLIREARNRKSLIY
ncbi:MAG: recombinase family protein [Sedimentibacter saalensis]|uniref:recombinase family protein n=1 Tax=Sedimentibacter saalensis TaxID=130788 RepID=UPI002B2041FB|nr:recombinase family protein [Sedimentibacter saalensis]MEA5096475.1 recombinase family protein [Sedimentibacter saalensis]